MICDDTAIPLPSIISVPFDVRLQFRELGATHISQMILRSTGAYGAPRIELYQYQVTFWDAQRREIGYWIAANPHNPMILAPNYRNWSQMHLDAESFAPIPEHCYDLPV